MRHKPVLLPAALLLIAASNGAAPPPAPVKIVSLAPMKAAIVDGGQIQGQLSASLAVVGGNAELLKEQTPVIRAAALAALNEHARLYASPYAAVDAATLSRDLTDAVHRAAPAADRVLIERVQAQPA